MEKDRARGAKRDSTSNAVTDFISSCKEVLELLVLVLSVECCVLRVACCVLRAACCVLRVACCLVWVIRTRMQ